MQQICVQIAANKQIVRFTVQNKLSIKMDEIHRSQKSINITECLNTKPYLINIDADGNIFC